MPPSILGEELNVSVVAGEAVALACRSHAVPPPVLSWWKDGRPLVPRPGVRLLEDGALLQVSWLRAPRRAELPWAERGLYYAHKRSARELQALPGPLPTAQHLLLPCSSGPFDVIIPD